MTCRRATLSRCCRHPRGGYELARERQRVTANDILRAAGIVEGVDDSSEGSEVLSKVVIPALASAEMEFGIALSRINVEDMARTAQGLRKSEAGSTTRS
jgi:DNA-binding IscR family transcriptional regulator